MRAHEPGGAEAAARVRASVRGLTDLERRELVAIALDGPQPLDRLADRLDASVVAVGAAARALVARGAAVRVPRGDGLPLLVASTGGTVIVRDALSRRAEPLRHEP